MKLSWLFEELELVDRESSNSDQGAFSYNVLQDGNPIGVIIITVVRNDDELIGNIEYVEGNFGISGMRSLLRQLKIKHPKITMLKGDRISGARVKSGKEGYIRRGI